MIYAIDKENRRIYAEDAEKSKEYYCPVCGEKVVPRQGDINVWHFAHENACTDTWTHDMSDWHKEMQDMFPAECQEVVVSHNGEKHRADVLVDRTVLEFQHSQISGEEFCARNDFYLGAGYKLAWIFDMRDADFEYTTSKNNTEIVRYRYPKRFLQYAPKTGRNEKDFAIWFCLEDDETFFGKVIWHTPDWTRFMFDSRYLTMGAKASDFVESVDDYIKTALKGYDYELKCIGQRGHPRNSYICPITGEFGLKLSGEKGCSYCRYCRLIVDKPKGQDVYCTFPVQCNSPDPNNLPGYECSAERI